MPRTPEGPPPEPAVQKLRLRYTKRGRLRFSSHRDFQRAFERALRRAGVPMAYSAGFTPHPKVSYAGAAPTGTASEAEYLELSVTQRVDPERLRAALDAALPPGMDVVECVEAGPGSLADRLVASEWEVRLPGVDDATAAAAVARFLAAGEVAVERLTKNGVRTLDARAEVLALELAAERSDTPGAGAAPAGGASPCAILHLVVRHATPAVRPDDVLTGLRQVADLAPPVPPQVTRLAQGPLADDGGSVTDPLEADRLQTQGAVGA
ncbi:MAG TPA: TIGR03936 family radical SAM-associated protein [Motilibacteraceae bacterium]|nr:TIGR03936 family radical SAM-associated protein [Motilibacteraceae bacterium]